MIEKPWYKKWWGILLILFGLVTLVNVATHETRQNNQLYTPSASETRQTPKKPDAEVLAEIENRLNEYQRTLKGHYPSEDMLKTLSGDALELHIRETGYSKADNESQKKTLLKARALRARVEALRRAVYAKILERSMLEQGFNAEVQAKGLNKNVLEYKFALMSKAMVYTLTNKGRVLETAKDVGFTKLIFTDGFDSSWTYDLTKQD